MIYNIYYKGDICGNPRTYEVTTDNFEKWLKWFNEERIEEGNMPFDKSDFDVEPADVIYFDKGERDEDNT